MAINETVQFGSLQITPRVCFSRPSTEAPQTDAFAEVDEVETDKSIKRIFSGWMFADSPGLHGIEHPVYDLWLTDCKGEGQLIHEAPPVADATTDLGAPDPKASGTLEAHYAPRAKVRMMSADALRSALGSLPQSALNPVAVYSRTIPVSLAVRAARTMPDNPAAAAHELFAVLRELDATGAGLIWIEAPPDAAAWEGVRDRLRRAAAA